MGKRTGGRLPFQSFITRSVCIAHAIFDATQGPDLVILEQSREIKSIARVPSMNGPTVGQYVLSLVHDLTYALTSISPPWTFGIYGHARAHISTVNIPTEHGDPGTPLLFTHLFMDAVNADDPTQNKRHFLAISAQALGEVLALADGIIEVSIFDVLEPEKRYITRENGKGLNLAKRFLPPTK